MCPPPPYERSLQFFACEQGGSAAACAALEESSSKQDLRSLFEWGLHLETHAKDNRETIAGRKLIKQSAQEGFDPAKRWLDWQASDHVTPPEITGAFGLEMGR